MIFIIFFKYFLLKNFFLAFTGTSACCMAFQAYLIEGLARWYLQRARDSVSSTDENSGVQRSFNVSLMHRLNSLSNDIHQQPSLLSIRTPLAFAGEYIGLEYLHLQTGGDTGTEKQLDKEIDEAFGCRDVSPKCRGWSSVTRREPVRETYHPWAT